MENELHEWYWIDMTVRPLACFIFCPSNLCNIYTLKKKARIQLILVMSRHRHAWSTSILSDRHHGPGRLCCGWGGGGGGGRYHLNIVQYHYFTIFNNYLFGTTTLCFLQITFYPFVRSLQLNVWTKRACFKLSVALLHAFIGHALPKLLLYMKVKVQNSIV